MNSTMPDNLTDSILAAVDKYRHDDDLGSLLDRLKQLAAPADAGSLLLAATRFTDIPEVVIPLYERIVALRPDDAQAMVVLANAYWLTGRGPDVVGDLASNAIAVDPSNRGAWHLWALAEPAIRERVSRWQQVTVRFPADQLARAALADNAASLAGAEHDPAALDLAIATYESLLRESQHPDQRSALETTLTTLRSWRL
jgi:hypothetical protein